MTAQELTSMLRTKLTTAETAASTTLRKERTSWERELQTRLQTEREKWEESTIPTTLTPAIAPSPPVVPYIPHRPSAASATESYFLGYSRRPPSRSPSVEPPRSSSGFRTPPVRQDSFPYYIGRADSFPQHQMHSRAENDHGEDADYTYFDTLSPSSPQRNTDMISVSTVAAGPSVQLVERMSAAVRRLESEMSGSREELARVVSQRDEARKEIVALMTEVGEKREACERVRRLEEQMEDGKVRLETTLEMLGEKSERVEELVQDVKDLKEMYRELVLSTSGGGR